MAHHAAAWGSPKFQDHCLWKSTVEMPTFASPVWLYSLPQCLSHRLLDQSWLELGIDIWLIENYSGPCAESTSVCLLKIWLKNSHREWSPSVMSCDWPVSHVGAKASRRKWWREVREKQREPQSPCKAPKALATQRENSPDSWISDSAEMLCMFCPRVLKL